MAIQESHTKFRFLLESVFVWKPACLRKACVVLIFALWGLTSAFAEYSSNGWTFSVKSDGTAAVSKPVSEHWETEWSDTYGWISVFKGYEDRILSSISCPSSVTAQTITYNSETGSHERHYGQSYTVSEVSSGMTTEQRNAVYSVSFASSIHTIANSAFSDCVNLSSVVIPSSIQTIGHYAFHNDSSLLEITIPNSVTSMGSYAFWNCISLQQVTVRWQTPLALGSTPFTGLTTRYIRLNVPEGTETAYRAAPVWRAFLIEMGAIDAYSPKVIGNSGSTSLTIYGGKITESTSIRLSQGETSVSAASISQTMPGQYAAAFDLQNIPTGMYDLHIQQTSVIDTVIVDGIKVQGRIYPKVVSRIEGSSRLRHEWIK